MAEEVLPTLTLAAPRKKTKREKKQDARRSRQAAREAAKGIGSKSSDAWKSSKKKYRKQNALGQAALATSIAEMEATDPVEDRPFAPTPAWTGQSLTEDPDAPPADPAESPQNEEVEQGPNRPNRRLQPGDLDASSVSPAFSDAPDFASGYGVTAENILSSLVKKNFSRSRLKSTEFIAVVLHVYPKPYSNLSPDMGSHYKTLSKLSNDHGRAYALNTAQNLIMIKARIPILDSLIPDPPLYNINNKMGVIPLHQRTRDMNYSIRLINMHSTFVGDAESGVPKVGDYVRVSYENLENRIGGQYLGIHAAGDYQPFSLEDKGAAQDAFDCKGAMGALPEAPEVAIAEASPVDTTIAPGAVTPEEKVLNSLSAAKTALKGAPMGPAEEDVLLYLNWRESALLACMRDQVPSNERTEEGELAGLREFAGGYAEEGTYAAELHDQERARDETRQRQDERRIDPTTAPPAEGGACGTEGDPNAAIPADRVQTLSGVTFWDASQAADSAEQGGEQHLSDAGDYPYIPFEAGANVVMRDGDPTFPLAKNFSFAEFIRTGSKVTRAQAKKYGLSPSRAYTSKQLVALNRAEALADPGILKDMAQLANMLQYIRGNAPGVKWVRITGGFRSKALSKILVKTHGASKKSSHMGGQAVDFQVNDWSNEKAVSLWKWITAEAAAGRFKFGRMILERNSANSTERISHLHITTGEAGTVKTYWKKDPVTGGTTNPDGGKWATRNKVFAGYITRTERPPQDVRQTAVNAQKHVT